MINQLQQDFYGYYYLFVVGLPSNLIDFVAHFMPFRKIFVIA